MSPDEGKVLQMHEGKGRRLNKPKRVAAFVFISPAVLFLVVFSVIPMLYSFGISFFHYNTSIYIYRIRCGAESPVWYDAGSGPHD